MLKQIKNICCIFAFVLFAEYLHSGRGKMVSCLRSIALEIGKIRFSL